MPRRNGEGIALLADPLRLRIVARIARGPCTPSTVASDLGISRSAVSRQLRHLVTADLVVRRPWTVDARRHLLFLAPTQAGAIVAWLAGTGLGLDESADGTIVTRQRRPPTGLEPRGW